ncbi:hypothetical protein ANCCAN_26824, partial [Ancylostoma caninum]
RFVDDCTLFGISRTPRLVRTSSCHEESHVPSRTPVKLNSHRQPPDEFTYRKISSPIATTGFSRRMSSSHGNLLSLVPSSNVVFDSADSLAETIDSRRVEVNFDLRPPSVKDCSTPATSEPRKEKQSKKPLSLTEKKKSPSIAKSPPSVEATKCKSDERDREDQGAYEWLSFVRRKKPEQAIHKVLLRY